MLISQDRHELFITFVPFEEGYKEEEWDQHRRLPCHEHIWPVLHELP